MDRRHARIKHLRVRVVAGAAGVFLAALGAVAAFGRQPATTVTHASTSTSASNTPTPTQTYDDYGSSSPTPMTSRSS
jgi:hypothetical protein